MSAQVTTHIRQVTSTYKEKNAFSQKENIFARIDYVILKKKREKETKKKKKGFKIQFKRYDKLVLIIIGRIFL